MKILYPLLLLIFTACSSDSNKRLDNIEEIKKDFIATILTESALDEGPFQMNYHLRVILFSDNVVSLMRDVFVLGIRTIGSVMSKKIIRLPIKRINYEISREKNNCDRC